MDGFLRKETSTGPKFGIEVDAKGRKQAAKLINKFKKKRQGAELKKTLEEDEFETEEETEVVKEETVLQSEIVSES